MRHHKRRTCVQLSLLLSAFFVLVGFLAHAGACLSPVPSCEVTPQVNSCHTITVNAPKTCAQSCCKSEACHTAGPVARDIGGPSYQNEQNASHPIAHDPRTQTPLFRVVDSRDPQFPASLITAIFVQQYTYLPNQTLSHLRTVILRH